MAVVALAAVVILVLVGRSTESVARLVDIAGLPPHIADLTGKLACPKLLYQLTDNAQQSAGLWNLHIETPYVCFCSGGTDFVRWCLNIYV